MREQIEGSRAVAEAVARCRPEVVCAYPISPQTHIVEALGRPGAARARWRRASTSTSSRSSPRCRSRIGASAAGARTYTATASQGLLYMAEALYNASGLGLPIVMTVANRAIGAPINIWNDHSDSMSQRDSRLDPALRRDQPGGGRPAHPGLPAGRAAVAAGDGVHGRLRPHPRLRGGRRCPSQEQVDAFLPPFEPRQVLDPADPVTIGAMVGPEAFTEVRYLAHAKQMQALDADPRRSPTSSPARSAATSGGLVTPYRSRTPTRSSSRSARCSAPSRTSSTSCATRACAIGALGDHLLPAVPAGGGARRAGAARSGWSSSSGRSRSAPAASSRQTSGWRWPGCRSHGARRRRRPRRPAGHPGVAARMLDDVARGPAGRADFLDLDPDLVERELADRGRRLGPHAENILRDSASSRRID